MTNQEQRKKDFDELHAKGKPTRLQVKSGGANLVEMIDGTTRHLAPGEVFDHTAPKRALQLLELGLVLKSDAPTAGELKSKQKEDEEAEIIMADEFRERAKKVLAARAEKLGKLEKGLRSMTPEILAAEVKKRDLKDVGTQNEEQVQAVLADELVKIKAGE